jgi:hypothetical protein
MDKAEAEQDQKKHMTQHEQGGPDEYDEEGGDYGFESRVQRQRERELRFKERSAKYGKEGK